jgi:hypothetical protein
LVSKYLPNSEMHFLMDDYARKDEREIVERWRRRATDVGYVVDAEDFSELEKQACLLKMRRACR